MKNRAARRRLVLGLAFLIPVALFAVANAGFIKGLIFAPTLPGYVKTAPVGEFAPLDWKQLEQGQWNYRSKPIVPPAVLAQNGKPVVVRGYLLPLHTPGEASQFFVAKNPRGCYFCSPPGVAEVVQVNVAGGRLLTPTDWPVSVYGIFKAATGQPGEEMLYTIDDAQLKIGK